MPQSRRRKDAEPSGSSAHTPVRVGSPRWLVPLMLAMFLLGLAWIVTYYVTQAQYPVPGLDNWNLLAGFGFILVGFGLATQWK